MLITGADWGRWLVPHCSSSQSQCAQCVGGTYSAGRAEPSPKKNCSICFTITSWSCLRAGFRRYSFSNILQCSIHWPQACCETCSRSEEHTSELQSHLNLVCRLLLEKKKTKKSTTLIEHTMVSNRLLIPDTM